MKILTFLFSLILTVESFFVPVFSSSLEIKSSEKAVDSAVCESYDDGRILIGSSSRGVFNSGDTAELFIGCYDDSLDSTTAKAVITESDNSGKTIGYFRIGDGVSHTILFEGKSEGAYLLTLNTADREKYQYRFCFEGEESFINLYPFNGETVSQMNPMVRDYQENYKKGYSDKYYEKGRKNSIYAPDGVTFSWTCSEPAERYELKLSLREDMSDAVSFTSDSPSLNVQDLFTGTHYFWQVSAVHADNVTLSSVFDFYTAEEHRTVFIEGANNTRDIGGCKSSLGGRVRQGMIFRGSSIDYITENGREKLSDTFGVHTDFDLREPNNSDGKLGENSKRINISARYYADLRNEENYASTIKVLKEFAKPENYPMYVHCAIGRDRTGCALMILEMLLGMKKKDIYMDYELSFFSAGCCEIDSVDVMMKQFDHMYDFIRNYSLGTAAHCAEKFLLDYGMTVEEISSIRQIMLEK